LKSGKKFGLAISGEYFGKIQGYENTNKLLHKQFCDILLRCEIAVFGEMVPNQKQSVIQIIKKFDPEKITLAIGDGVNDIPMLSEAHVGVAILRSSQYNLCKVSDYYIQKFYQLKLLLFFFGRGCYRRNSKVILYMFFKNIFYVMTTFWSGTLNQFSATSLKPLIMENFYGLLLTTFPMIQYGIFDKIFSKEQLLFSPLMYQTGKRRLYLNDKKFLHELILSVLFSCYLTFLCLILFDWGNYKNGVSYGWYNFGNMLTMGIIITVNLRVIILANAWSIWTFLILFFSLALYFGIWIYESLNVNSNLYSSFLLLIQTYQFYIFLIYVFTMTIMEYILIKMEYYQIDKKFIPDFDVQFDAIAKGEDVELELLYSGVSNRELNINDNQKYFNPEDESDDDGWDDDAKK
jgi:magnesium-transporting ATPase (P-type)